MAKTKQSNKEKQHIILVTGGTGGHIFPALATSEELIKTGYTISVMMDKRGKKYFPLFKNTRYQKTILCKGVNSKGLFSRFVSLFFLTLGVIQSLFFFLRVRPCFLVGYGGYFSFPPLLVARLLRIPYALHEQNSTLGLANRVLLPHASFLALSFEETDLIPNSLKNKSIYTGIPLREHITHLKNSPYHIDSTQPLNLFIIGGSLGARIFTDIVPLALTQLPDDLKKRLHVTAQVALEDIPSLQKIYDEHHITCHMQPFFDDIPHIIKQSTFIISRAGSSTLSEIATINRPCLFVPLPIATNDHQKKNVQTLLNKKAALTIPQQDFTSDGLCNLLTEVFSSPEILIDLHKNLAFFSKVDGTKNLCDQIINHL